MPLLFLNLYLHFTIFYVGFLFIFILILFLYAQLLKNLFHDFFCSLGYPLFILLLISQNICIMSMFLASFHWKLIYFGYFSIFIQAIIMSKDVLYSQIFWFLSSISWYKLLSYTCLSAEDYQIRLLPWQLPI